MDIIGLYYCNITHAKIILTNQKRVVDYISKRNKNIVKYLKKKYQYNRLDATHASKHSLCGNCLTITANGTSMWRKPSGCSSYGVNFFNSFREHALIDFFFIDYIFLSMFRYFSLYLFSILAFCSFFLFLLLYSVLVTHHSAVSDLCSSINSIKNCLSSAVTLEDIAWSIVLQITTAGTTTRCQL